jgi:glycosyltransferase involved in cell wall biosynthesis
VDTAMSIRISSIVCTYRNPGFLEGAINSLLDQTLPPDRYEILVVDNNSQDETPEVVRRLGARPLPSLRYVFEPRQGLSHARNRGVEAARGEIVAFLDADAEAGENWLSALLGPYAMNDDIWAVGGRILPIWHTTERPAWWDEEFRRWLSLVDWGDDSRPLTWPERILGTNCSFRKSIFREIGGFDPKLGRRGASLLGSEEAEIQQRINLSNKTVYYAAEAVVHHHVPPERLTEGYFFRRQFGSSRSQMAILVKQKGRAKGAWVTMADALRLMQRLLLIALIVARRRIKVPFVHKRMVYHYWGHIVGFAENLVTRQSA